MTVPCRFWVWGKIYKVGEDKSCKAAAGASNEVNKYKAQLNFHSGKQELGVNYFETYMPVASNLSFVNCCHSELLIVGASGFCYGIYTRTYRKQNEYDFASGSVDMVGYAKDFVLHLINSIYGQKQAGLVWFAHISDRLLEIGFQPLKSDECVFVHGKCVFVLYVDNGIFMSTVSSRTQDWESGIPIWLCWGEY